MRKCPDVSDAVVPASFCATTLICAAKVGGPAGVHVQLVIEPPSPAHSGMAVKVCPPSRESPTSMRAAPVAVHSMVDGTSANTFSPPTGVVSAIVSGVLASVNR
jgi:hypothetical protein